MTEHKEWIVEYSHEDGRSGSVKVITEICKSGGFQYGNGKSGMLAVGGTMQIYDLRYNRARNLHMVMLKDYFGKGLVKATAV